jgi:hypothetical protein
MICQAFTAAIYIVPLAVTHAIFLTRDAAKGAEAAEQRLIGRKTLFRGDLGIAEHEGSL